MTEAFKITSLSRADFEAEGYDPSGLSDADMERIASKMADVYVEHLFWEQVRFHAEDRNLPEYVQPTEQQ